MNTIQNERQYDFTKVQLEKLEAELAQASAQVVVCYSELI